MNEKLIKAPERMKSFLILKQLEILELKIRDPKFMKEYEEALAKTSEGKSEIELSFIKRVGELRREGNFSSVQKLMERARQMVDLSEDEMKKVFTDFEQEIKKEIEI